MSINFEEKLIEPPFIKFKYFYDIALKNNQKSIEAMAISSFSKDKDEVSSRFVNCKYVTNSSLIFFSNYNSPKAIEFKDHKQISALFFWNTINTQIRIKASIKKTKKDFNNEYFFRRDKNKNALSISSNQSEIIDSYEQVVINYNNIVKSADLKKCPSYWGGYALTPYYFEFWQGHESRINKREVFDKANGFWKHSFLQP